jgi:hypothetical protein
MDDFMDVRKQDKADNAKRVKETKGNVNDILGFIYAAIKNIVKVAIWVTIGTNILFLAHNYEPVDPSIYRKDIPYSLYKSNFLAAWFGKTMITTWSTYRSLTQKMIFNPIGDAVDDDASDIKKTLVILLSPILVIIGIFVVSFVGFVTTIYGAFRKGDEECQQTWGGIIVGLIMLIFGILFMIAGYVGTFQSIYFFSLTIIYPLLQESGRHFLFKTLSNYKNLVAMFYGLTLVYLSVKYLNKFVASGMLLSLVITSIMSYKHEI